jgi:hypothetical protein
MAERARRSIDFGKNIATDGAILDEELRKARRVESMARVLEPNIPSGVVAETVALQIYLSIFLGNSKGLTGSPGSHLPLFSELSRTSPNTQDNSVSLVKQGFLRTLPFEVVRADNPAVDEEHLSKVKQEDADLTWRDGFRVEDRVAYIRQHRQQFEFGGFADLLGCVRGSYFKGHASELLRVYGGP